MPSDRGWVQAVSELKAVERVTEGRITVGEIYDIVGHRRIDITVDCSDESSQLSNRPLNEHEPFSILVWPQYPLHMPTVRVPHRRFAGLPHVVWNEYICLHVGDNDWDPNRGMRGLVERLLSWLEHVAAGTLIGPDLPWDPPITRATPQLGTLIIHPELPQELVTAKEPSLALALVEAVGGWKYELRQWLPGPGDVPAEAIPRMSLAIVVILRAPVAYSYPDARSELFEALGRQGVPLGTIQDLVTLGWAESIRTWPDDNLTEEALPLPLLLVVSPTPEFVKPYRAAAHVAAWCADPFEHDEEVLWLRVYDQRSSITTRRDHTRPTRWLADRKILLLGCGALGAPVAEFCVRAAAKSISCVDKGLVTPGILVRQPYGYDDIGHAKAKVLSERLRGIASGTTVEGQVDDAIPLVAQEGFLAEFDLVIDATANPSVAASLELGRWTANANGERPPLLSVMVGHSCELGIVTLALPTASGAGVDVLRRLAVTGSEHDEWHDVLDDFFPDPPRNELFQPEPGCSDPTFVGSAADMAAFAGRLLNAALTQLAAPQPSNALLPSLSATVVRSGELAESGPTIRRLQWRSDVLFDDTHNGYQIRVAPAALDDIRLEAARAAELHGQDHETGGLLLGQIDQASRVVWVSGAQQPPPGSRGSGSEFVLDLRTTWQALPSHRSRSRGFVTYMGAWHTHPAHAALPSAQDVQTMREFAHDGMPVLLMVIGGGPGRLPAWIDGRGRPDVHVQLFLPE